MKKHLLIALSISLCFVSAIAQRATHQNTLNNQVNRDDNPSQVGFYIATPAKPSVVSDRVINKIKFASSWNALTLLVSEANCLTANQATNTIMFTHRINKTWKAPNVNSGFIQSTYSKDGGNSWDSLLHTQEQDPNRCRYPSGAIFNPAANTNPDNAFGVVSGPVTDGTTPNGWKGNFFASTQLNKTNNNVKLRLNATAGVRKQHFARISIQSTDNKVIVTGGLYNGQPDAATLQLQAYRGAMINIGTKSGTAFNWAVDSIKPACKKPAAGFNYMYTQSSTAWSKDGTTGYLVFLGVDNAATGNKLAYQPMVWKTTNGGSTWTRMPAYDYTSIPVINAKLRPSMNTTGTTANGPKKAWYSLNNGFDALVDNSGNLHIICVVASGYSTHADSLDYTYNPTNFTSYIYDTYTTAAGWSALLIDSLRCVPATTSSPFMDSQSMVYNIDARIQGSISTDGTHIFYMWMDSDPGAIGGENAIPDIYGRGWNLSTALSTPLKQFTYTGDNYYMFTSNVALVSGSLYTIPTTVSNSRDGSNNVDSAFDHFYVSGIEFDETEFTIPTPVGGTVGVNENILNGNIAVSQNYPNPFSKSTSVEVTLKEAAEVKLEVYNTIGQNVSSQNIEKLNAGTHTFVIDGSKLSPGIYFYTIRSGDMSITRKMTAQ